MRQIILIVHNIRSTHNVGALFRTADGFGVESIILSGYTPFPSIPNDPRLPHIHEKLTRQIHKTALGAERTVPFTHTTTVPLDALKADGYRIVGLEQAPQSQKLQDYHATDKIALLIGEEVDGISPELLAHCDDVLEIDMVGKKESFNVSIATGIALYALTISK